MNFLFFFKKVTQKYKSFILFLLFFTISLKSISAAGVSNWDTPTAGHPYGCMIDSNGDGVGDIPTLNCLELVFGNLLNMSSVLIVIVLFVMFVIGAFSYITSAGDHDKVAKAQNTLKFAVIGAVLFVSAFLIIKIIDTLFLGGCGRLFNFSVDNTYESTPGQPCPN